MPSFWMVAADRPNSLTRSRITPSEATIASRPKADGGSRRTRTTSVASWPATRTAWATSRIVPPRRDRRPISSIRWSVASADSGDGARLLGHDMVNVPPVGRGPALAQRRLGFPAERGGERRVDHLARRAVGPAGIELHVAPVAHHRADQLDELGDGDVGARPEVDDLLGRIVFHQVNHAV